MAFDESLAARIRMIMGRRVQEKKMFGGLAFLLRGNLCVGVWKDSLIARIGPEQQEEAMREPHVKPFDITGKPMKGWVLVSCAGVADEDRLDGWVRRAVQFVGKLPAK
jgi:hypothetical protein